MIMKQYSVIITFDRNREKFIGKIKIEDKVVEMISASSYTELIASLFRFLDRTNSPEPASKPNTQSDGSSSDLTVQLPLF
jgi:hypothetical protein